MWLMREFVNAYQGWIQEQNESWDRTREICYWTFKPHAKNPKQLKRTDLFTLPSDKKQKTADQSKKHETYKLMEKWDKK